MAFTTPWRTLQILGHALPPQVQIAIAQPQLFFNRCRLRFRGGDLEGQLLANGVQQLDLVGVNLHRPGGQLGIQGSFRSLGHPPWTFGPRTRCANRRQG
jgi:hypothetical protein